MAHINPRYASGLDRTDNQKWTTYTGDGNGRDGYIVFGNGGLNELRYYEGSKPVGFRQSPVRHSPKVTACKEATAFDYPPDGSGRDSYIIRNYGLKANYRSQFREFEKGLRSDIHTPAMNQRQINQRDPWGNDATRYLNWPSPTAQRQKKAAHVEQRRSIERLSPSPIRGTSPSGKPSHSEFLLSPSNKKAIRLNQTLNPRFDSGIKKRMPVPEMLVNANDFAQSNHKSPSARVGVDQQRHNSVGGGLMRERQAGTTQKRRNITQIGLRKASHQNPTGGVSNMQLRSKIQTILPDFSPAKQIASPKSALGKHLNKLEQRSKTIETGAGSQSRFMRHRAEKFDTEEDDRLSLIDVEQPSLQYVKHTAALRKPTAGHNAGNANIVMRNANSTHLQSSLHPSDLKKVNNPGGVSLQDKLLQRVQKKQEKPFAKKSRDSLHQDSLAQGSTTLQGQSTSGTTPPVKTFNNFVKSSYETIQAANLTQVSIDPKNLPNMQMQHRFSNIGSPQNCPSPMIRKANNRLMRNANSNRSDNIYFAKKTQSVSQVDNNKANFFSTNNA